MRAPGAVRSLRWPVLRRPPQCARRPAASKAQSKLSCTLPRERRVHAGRCCAPASGPPAAPRHRQAPRLPALAPVLPCAVPHSKAVTHLRYGQHAHALIMSQAARPHAQLPGRGPALAGRQTATLLSSGATCYASAATLDNPCGHRAPNAAHNPPRCWLLLHRPSDVRPLTSSLRARLHTPQHGTNWIERSSQARSSNRLSGDRLNGSQPPNHHTNPKHLLPYQRSVASLKLIRRLTWNPRTAGHPQRRC